MIIHLVILILILILAGIFGGIINYFRTYDYHKFKFRDFLKSLILGIGASLLMPIIIKLLQLDLFESSKTNPLDYFNIFSLGLIIGIFSSHFIDQVGYILLKQFNNFKNEYQEDKKDYVNSVTEIDKDESVKTFNFSLTEDHVHILEVMNNSKFIYRAINKITEEVDKDKEVVRQSLNELKEHYLVEQIDTPKGKKWKLTNDGRDYIPFYYAEGSGSGSLV